MKILTDPETCSWCVDEVEDSSLTCLNDGARICRACKRENPATVKQIGIDHD